MENQELQNRKAITSEDVWSLIYATTEQLKESERLIKETDRQLKETALQIKENDAKSNAKIDKYLQLYGGFTNEFGKIVEDLCKPAALKIFKKEVPGIDHIYEGPRHMRKDEEEIEVDILLCNKIAAVAVEVKTTCYKKDVDHFLSQMRNFKTLFREFEGKAVYVAIAAMRYANGSDTYARRKGLYALTATGDGLFTMGKPGDRKVY